MGDAQKPGDEGHEERVRKAFDALHEGLGETVGEEARGSLERLREAAARRDAEAMREHLSAVRERHGWLYEKLARHPDVASLLNELALLGL